MTLGGCAPAPTVRLHADPAMMARLAPQVVAPLDAQATDQKANLDRDLARANERLTKAELAQKQAAADPRTADTGEIRDAKIARAEAEVRWQRALLEAARWRGVYNQATNELARAQLLSHTGHEVDTEAFVEQQARVREQLDNANRRATAERSRFEERDRNLNAAKEKYAQAHAVVHASR
jgi:hypothetical protein